MQHSGSCRASCITSPPAASSRDRWLLKTLDVQGVVTEGSCSRRSNITAQMPSKQVSQQQKAEGVRGQFLHITLYIPYKPISSLSTLHGPCIGLKAQNAWTPKGSRPNPGLNSRNLKPDKPSSHTLTPYIAPILPLYNPFNGQENGYHHLGFRL